MGFLSSKEDIGADEMPPREEKYFKPSIQIAWIIDNS
jgi:hypothetical protein